MLQQVHIKTIKIEVQRCSSKCLEVTLSDEQHKSSYVITAVPRIGKLQMAEEAKRKNKEPLPEKAEKSLAETFKKSLDIRNKEELPIVTEEPHERNSELENETENAIRDRLWTEENRKEDERQRNIMKTWGRQLTSRSPGQVRSGQLLFSNRLVRSGQVRSETDQLTN
jgi:hypothetical protein